MDWTTPENIARLLWLDAEERRLLDAYQSQRDLTTPEALRVWHAHDEVEAELEEAQQAAPALAAEVTRLREREALLVGLLRDAASVVDDHLGASYPVLLDSIDAAITPGGS